VVFESNADNMGSDERKYYLVNHFEAFAAAQANGLLDIEVEIAENFNPDDAIRFIAVQLPVGKLRQTQKSTLVKKLRVYLKNNTRGREWSETIPGDIHEKIGKIVGFNRKTIKGWERKGKKPDDNKLMGKTQSKVAKTGMLTHRNACKNMAPDGEYIKILENISDIPPALAVAVSLYEYLEYKYREIKLDENYPTEIDLNISFSFYDKEVEYWGFICVVENGTIEKGRVHSMSVFDMDEIADTPIFTMLFNDAIEAIKDVEQMKKITLLNYFLLN
jgi:hypothetical protein